ncbi:hypothetical protein [Prochlorococcus marinus]|uniref:hypothetical protein n=1 Tax=Prochlorococcus marinus TaxID=1219 RepID=UPI001C577871|nr:hypothetical protein [Prochlorococcus marinus]
MFLFFDFFNIICTRTHPKFEYYLDSCFCALFTKEALALRISRAMFNERRSIESFNAYQCIRSYLVDLSMQELIELAKDYGIELGKASNVKNIGG